MHANWRMEELKMMDSSIVDQEDSDLSERESIN
jgi:hypothetical protein